MKSSFFIFIIISSISTCYSQINVDQPCSNGKITLKRYRFDALTFSNDVKINFSILTKGNAESPKIFVGMAIENSGNAGYKYLQTAKYRIFKYNDDGRIDSLIYYSSKDTSWSESPLYPDSIIPLDLISDTDIGSFQVTKRTGRYILQSESTISPFPHTTESPFDNYNILIYINTPMNKMKLQISEIYMNSYPTTTPFDDYILDSMEIRWAVDSLGNGKFIEPLGIKKSGVSKTSQNSIKYCKQLFSPFNSKSDRFSFYGVNGRKLLNSDAYRLSSGLFIIRPEDGSLKNGKLLRQ